MLDDCCKRGCSGILPVNRKKLPLSHKFRSVFGLCKTLLPVNLASKPLPAINSVKYSDCAKSIYMSKRVKRANLPQISAGKRPFSLIFSCPGDDTPPFCHRFHPEQTQRQDSKEPKRTVLIDSKNESI